MMTVPVADTYVTCGPFEDVSSLRELPGSSIAAFYIVQDGVV